MKAGDKLYIVGEHFDFEAHRYELELGEVEILRKTTKLLHFRRSRATRHRERIPIEDVGSRGFATTPAEAWRLFREGAERDADDLRRRLAKAEEQIAVALQRERE